MFHRIDKINQLLKKEIAMIIQRELHREPPGFITITQVITTHDLRSAKVFLSVMGDSRTVTDTMRILEDQAVHIQHLLSKRVRLKFTPVLAFVVDDSLDKSMKVTEILDEIKNKSDTAER